MTQDINNQAGDKGAPLIAMEDSKGVEIGNMVVPMKGDEAKERVLPSGRTARMIKFKGKHIKMARRQANENTDEESFMFIVISLLTTIDGQPILAEDIEEMDGIDVLALMEEFKGATFRDTGSDSVS